jgi:hypothetical protein
MPDEIQSPYEPKESEDAIYVTPTYDCYQYDVGPASKMPDIDDVKNKDDVDTYGQYVGAQVRVPIGDEIRTEKVVRRELDWMELLEGERTPTQCWTQGLMILSSLVATGMSILSM